MDPTIPAQVSTDSQPLCMMAVRLPLVELGWIIQHLFDTRRLEKGCCIRCGPAAWDTRGGGKFTPVTVHGPQTSL